MHACKLRHANDNMLLCGSMYTGTKVVVTQAAMQTTRGFVCMQWSMQTDTMMCSCKVACTLNRVFFRVMMHGQRCTLTPNLIVWWCMHIHAHPRTALYVKLHAWAFPCALTPGIICTNTRNYLRGAVSTITHTDIKIQAERRSSLQLVSHRALARALLWRVGVFELVFFEQNEGPHYSWCHTVLWRTRCFGA